MRIIISPAKKMKTDTDTFAWKDLPAFLQQARRLRDWINTLSYEDARKLWACNEKIASGNRERFRNMDFEHNLTPAILSYDGIQYTCMAPSVFEDSQLDYIQENLRILSGLYGVLRPMDGVTPYRLEMQAKVDVDGCSNLYDFWQDALYREVMDGSRTVINLASREYGRCVETFLRPGDRLINCVFGEPGEGRVMQKGVYVKMARGDMVRFMAVHRIREPEQIRAFNWSGYAFSEDLSNESEYVFLRTEVPGKGGRKK